MSTEYLPKDINRLNSELESKFLKINEILDVVLKYSEIYGGKSPSKLLPFDFDKSSPQKSNSNNRASPNISPIKSHQEGSNSKNELTSKFSPGLEDADPESPEVKVKRLLENTRQTEKVNIATPEKENETFYGAVTFTLGDEESDQSTAKKRPITTVEPSTANTYSSNEPELSSQKKIVFPSLENMENISGFNTEDTSKIDSARAIQQAYREYKQKGLNSSIRVFLEYVSLEHLANFCCLVKETYKKIATQDEYFEKCARKIQRNYKSFASAQKEKNQLQTVSKQNSLGDNASITEFSVGEAPKGFFDSQGSKGSEPGAFIHIDHPIPENNESLSSDSHNKLQESDHNKQIPIEAEGNFSFRQVSSESQKEAENHESEGYDNVAEPKGLCLEDLQTKHEELRDPNQFEETQAHTPADTNPTTPLKNSKVICDENESNLPLQSDLSPTVTEHLSELYQDGTFYEGQKVNGLRHGKGNYDFNNGFKYFGDWVHDEMYGFGAMTVNEKVLYEGYFENNIFKGHGTLYNLQMTEKRKVDFNTGELPEWQRYEGKFEKGMRDGFGILFFINGDHYMGNFKEGLFKGQGTYTCPGEYSLVGKWDNNILKETIIRRSLVKTSVDN